MQAVSLHDVHGCGKPIHQRYRAECCPALAGRCAQAGGESGSDDEDDEGDLSDEAMFRMDAKLAAFFAAAQDSKRGARAQRNELLNFKMRVIALLEAFCKKVRPAQGAACRGRGRLPTCTQ